MSLLVTLVVILGSGIIVGMGLLKGRWRKTLLHLFVFFSLIYGVLLLMMGLFQEKMVYYPLRELRATPADVGLTHEEVWLKTHDGETLHAWWVSAGDGASDVYSLLYFHGNASNISYRLKHIERLHDLGFNVFIVDYRGYGRSSGHPSEQGTYWDADAAWAYLTSTRQILSNHIVVLGRSLGGGIASYVAQKYQPAGLILESTFSSLVDVGRHHYPYMPVALMARIRYPTIERLPQLQMPVLIVHSPEDRVVPYRLGRKNFRALSEPKDFIEIKGDHNWGVGQSLDIYRAGIQRWKKERLSVDPESSQGKSG